MRKPTPIDRTGSNHNKGHRGNAMKWWDVKAMPVFRDESPEDYQIRKWLSQVPHGGIVGQKAVLVCYNRMHPARSILIVEDIQI